MSMSQMDTFGFELLQKLYTNDILKKEDVIVLFVHWYLLRCGFRCVGLGDSRVLDASDTGTELLPNEWSKNANYALRYVKDNKLYILHGTKSDEDLLFNFLSVEDRNVSNSQFPIGQTVTDLHGPLESLMPAYRTVLKTIQVDLIEPMVPNSTNESGTQTSATAPDTDRARRRSPDDDPLRVMPDRNTPRGPHGLPDDILGNLGRADLDPLARPQAGGMIFDPFDPNMRRHLDPAGVGGIGIPGRLPPGAIPPGARFDPFGPPDPAPRPRFGGRDNFMPPDYDDMFR